MRPASLLEEIGEQICELLNPIRNLRASVFIGVRFVRPVNDERLADNQFAWNKAPVTAVRAVVAVVSQYQIMCLGHRHGLEIGIGGGAPVPDGMGCTRQVLQFVGGLCGYGYIVALFCLSS